MEEFGCRKIDLEIGDGGRRKTLEKKNEKFDDSTVPIRNSAVMIFKSL
jgi:hypothetical protein